MAKRQFQPPTDHLPVYPLHLREAPDGHVYIKQEGGGWAWAGQKRGGLWIRVNTHFELLLAKELQEQGYDWLNHEARELLPKTKKALNGLQLARR